MSWLKAFVGSVVKKCSVRPPAWLRGRRLSLIYQTEVAECGLACIGMIAGFHRNKVSLSALRVQFPTALKGSSFFDLIRLGGVLGLCGRALRLDVQDLGRLVCPAVLHWDCNHFIVLAGCSRGRIVIFDPARGVSRMKIAECAKHFTGMALEFTPTSAFRSSGKRAGTAFKEILGTFDGLRRTLCIVLALSLLLEGFSILYPLLLQIVVDRVLPARDTPLLLQLGAGFLLFGLLDAWASAMRAGRIAYARSRLNHASAARIFRHLIHLPMSFFERRHLGDVLSRFSSLRRVQEGITSDLIVSMVDGFMVAVTVAVMISYDMLLAAISVAVVAAQAIARYFAFRHLRRATEDGLIATAKEQTHILETLRGMQSIKIYGRESERVSEWMSRVAERIGAEYRVAILGSLLGSVGTLLNWLGYVGVVVVGAMAIMDGRLSSGQLFAFSAYYMQLTQRAGALINQLIALRMLELHADRVFDITNTRIEQNMEATGARIAICGRVQVSNLAYRYGPDEPLLFRGLAFDVAPQESVAIVGGTGIGKSSLIKLLIGLLIPTCGVIRIDGCDMRSLDKVSYRSQIAAVTEDERLFAGTIRDNISFFEASPDPGWIRSSAELAGISEDIDAMPMKYESVVGDMGSALSAGQRQRLLLARAIYRRPKILFLDEATSHLDVRCERFVNESIRQLRITKIFVAHRPETIKSADRVLDLGLFRVPAGASGERMLEADRLLHRQLQ